MNESSNDQTNLVNLSPGAATALMILRDEGRDVAISAVNYMLAIDMAQNIYPDFSSWETSEQNEFLMSFIADLANWLINYCKTAKSIS